MSEKQALCSGRVYRGVVILTVAADGATRYVVIGTARGHAVNLYECETWSEACALVDSALALERVSAGCCCLERLGDNDTCPLHGGPRLVGFELASIPAV